MRKTLLPDERQPPLPTLAATKLPPQNHLMDRGWTTDRSPSDASIRALEREVFERVFGYRAARGVKVPRFTGDHEMMEAVISHIKEAWQPREFRIWRRLDAEAGCAVEAMIRTGPNSAYGGSGPTRGVAVCRAALFLAANSAPRSRHERPAGTSRAAGTMTP